MRWCRNSWTRVAGSPIGRTSGRRSLPRDEASVLQDAIHLRGRIVQQGFGLSFAEQDADNRFTESGGELVRFRMKVGRRNRLREHRFRRLIVGPRLNVVAV